MKKLFLLALILGVFLQKPALAETLKAGIQYSLKDSQEIKLRVSRIPKKFPWLEKNDDGSFANPEAGSVIVTENIEDITIDDPYGESIVIPAGSSFFAKVADKQAAKRFWKKAKLKLDFFRLEIDDGAEYLEDDGLISNHGKAYDGKNMISPSLNKLAFNSSIENTYKDKGKNSFGDILKNSASTIGYTLAGAVAAPLLAFSIGNSLSSAVTVGSLSNPFVTGGLAAAGAGAGFVYGLAKKGKEIPLTPGSEIILNLKDPWFLASEINKDELKQALKKRKRNLIATSNPRFALKVLGVKKAKDSWGDKSLKISIAYNNKTGEELRYTSFQLVDSMGKAYIPDLKSIDESVFGELPQVHTMNLYFTVDFLDTSHELKVVRSYDQKTIARKRIVLM